MRDFSKSGPGFWIGKTGRELRGHPEAQIVAHYLMTAPGSSMIGVYYCPMVTIANDTGLSVEGASKGLRRAIEGDFCTYDEASEWVWVREMARFQFDDALSPKDNRVKGIGREFSKLPESQLKQGFHERYQHAFHLPRWRPAAPFSGSPSEGPSKTLRSIEKEKEEERDTKSPSQGAGLSGKGSVGGGGSDRRGGYGLEASL